MEKRNEITVRHYELHHKQFIAKIVVSRANMFWGLTITDKNNIQIAHETNIHFMSEFAIEERVKTTIDDCISNPEEYYDN